MRQGALSLYKLALLLVVQLMATSALSEQSNERIGFGANSDGKKLEGHEFTAQQPQNTLPMLIAEGVSKNPAIQSKLKLVDGASYGVDAAKWQFFPTPIASVQQARANKNDPSYQGTNKVIQLSLQQPIWVGGRLTAGLSLAEKQLAIAMVDLQDSKEAIALRIVSAFGGWFSANEKVLALDDSVQSHRSLQALIRRRIASGLSPENEYLFAVGRLDQALTELEVAKTQRANAITTLSQIIGEPLNQENLLRIRKFYLSYHINAEEALQMALERRPSILKARAQIELQDSQIAIAKSALSPALSVSIQRQNGNFSYNNSVTNIENRAFLTLSTNLGAGLSNFSQISGAKAQRDAAVADEESARRNTSEEIYSTTLLLSSNQFRVKSMESACFAASVTAQSWQRQFFAGKKAWQDLLNSVRELSTCKGTLAEAREAVLVLNWKLAIFSYGLDGALSLPGMM